jgi:hypothetical protein
MKNLNQMDKLLWWKDQLKMSAKFVSSTIFKLLFFFAAIFAYASYVLKLFKVVLLITVQYAEDQ